MASFAIPLAISGISALGGLLGSRDKKTTQTVDQTQTNDSTTTPTRDFKSQSLQDLLINHYLDQLQSNDDYFSGYTNEGLSNINKSTDASSRSIQNLLAARGIRGGAAGAALSSPVVSGMQQKASFLNSIPGLRDQRNQSILQQTGSFLSSLPVGQTSHSTATNKGTTTTVGQGNMAAGGLSSLGTTLAGLYGAGAFSGNGSSNSYKFPAGMVTGNGL